MERPRVDTRAPHTLPLESSRKESFVPFTKIVPLGLFTAIILLSQPVYGQRSLIDVRVNGGYSYLLAEDDPAPNAGLVGGAVTVAIGRKLRIGLEVLGAQQFGQDNGSGGGMLVSPILERGFLQAPRVKPYLVGGLGLLRRKGKGSLSLGGGVGVRLFLTRHLFLAPEVRLGAFPRLRSTVSVGIAF